MTTDTVEVVDFMLPSLGSDMDEGTVLTWLVGVGDHVVKGDVLVQVDTEKAEIDVEVWHEAVVVELLVQPGDTVPVGTPIARLETGAGSGSRTPGHDAAPQPPVDVEALTQIVPQPTPPARPRTRRPSMPAAERTAVGVVQVTPRMVFWPGETNGASTARPTQPQTQPAPSRAERRQAAVAALMERSNHEIPHFHLVRQLDLSVVLDWLDRHNESVPPPQRILPAAVMLYGVAKAAAGTTINGTYDDGPVDAPHVDLAVAVHVRGGGLMTPVLPAAETMTLDGLMHELQAMVGRARSNRLSSRDLTPATLTVTNLGDAGADRVLGVIRPPERALVGFGQVVERGVAVDGQVEVRRTVDVSLSADHRVINGHAGARFLEALNTILSKPDDITLTAEDPNEH